MVPFLIVFVGQQANRLRRGRCGDAGNHKILHKARDACASVSEIWMSLIIVKQAQQETDHFYPAALPRRRSLDFRACCRGVSSPLSAGVSMIKILLVNCLIRVTSEKPSVRQGNNPQTVTGR
jgi:hypothetical protein